MKTEITHPFPALYNQDSHILILGSFPSVKSREQQFFYGHPQNRFWRVMAAVLNCEIPQSIDEKKEMLLNHASCRIEGSSDASIENVVPNDLTPIFSAAEIRQIFCNGKKSWEMYHRFIEPLNGRPAVCLPSTSPANAAWNMERLIAAWSVIRG